MSYWKLFACWVRSHTFLQHCTAADDAIQMDVHKMLYLFYTKEKAPCHIGVVDWFTSLAVLQWRLSNHEVSPLYIASFGLCCIHKDWSGQAGVWSGGMPLVHGHNFVVKCGGDSLVWNQYSHRVDAEVNFYKCRFPILSLEVFWEQH